MKSTESHKRHWSFVVTDKKYLYTLVALLTVVGILAGIKLNDPTCFSRVGNFIIGIGVWMSMRYTLREGINKHKDLSKSSPTLPGNGPLSQLNLKFLNEIAFSIGDAKLQLHGFFIVIYGSAVSSFGDIILKWIIEKC